MSYENTCLLVPCVGNNEDTMTPDLSKSGYTLTASGSAEISNTQPKFAAAPYGTSAAFTLAGAAVFSTAHDGSIAISGKDFTVEFWMYADNFDNTQGLLFIGNSSSNNNRIQITLSESGTVSMFDDTADFGSGRFTDPINTKEWTHIRFVRAGGTFYSFRNGVLDDSGSSSTGGNSGSSMPNIYLGVSRTSSLIRYYDGFLQDVRFIVGEALSTSAFTPPDRLAHNYAGTVKDGSDNPLERTIRVHERESGMLMVEMVSDASGDFSAIGPNVKATAIALGDDGGSENGAIFDSVAASA